MSLISTQGQTGEVMRDAIRDLEVTMISDPETVQCRRNFFIGEQMFEGITLHPITERYAAGTIGTHDVDFPWAITFVQHDSGDAILNNDSLEQSVHEVRQRFSSQRLGLGNLPSVSEHTCTITPSTPTYPAKKFPDYRVRQLLVHVWGRINDWSG